MAHMLIRNEYDLDLTMFPSFTSSLFDKVSRNYWIKIHGSFKGLKLKFNGRFLEANIDNIDIINTLSGLWYDPEEHLRRLSRSLRQKVDPIVEVYEKVRLSINPYDKELVFLATVLSQRTNYHINVVKWVRRIALLMERGMDIRSVNMTSFGKSYQLRRANIVVKQCIDLVRLDSALNMEDIWKIKRELLKCEFVGPKVANAYLMFTRRAPYIAPIDVHFLRFIRNLGLLEFKRKPLKSVCQKYTCSICTFKHECVEALVMKEFKTLSSWIQTVAYVHDKVYCAKKKCNVCPFKDLCVRL